MFRSELVGIAGCLALAYLVAIGLLWTYGRRHPDIAGSREVVRFLPDVVRFVRRLAADPTLPKGVRIRLILLLLYLLSPVDLVPDFIPVVGYADDAIVVALILRSVIRRAGPEAVEAHWPGTPGGLAILRRLVGDDPMLR